MDAVLYGDDPKHKQRLFTAVDGVVDKQKIETLIRERKLTSEGLDPRTVTEIREKMERAGARRLQPYYIRAFFEKAFTRLGGQIRRRETGRYEITRVPGRLRDRDRFSGGVVPIAERYERVCFDKEYRDTHKPQAAIITPGHGLLDVTIAVTLEEAGDVLKRGAILVDEADEYGLEPRVLVTLGSRYPRWKTGPAWAAECRVAQDAVRHARWTRQRPGCWTCALSRFSSTPA